MTRQSPRIRQLVFSAVCLALCMVLPFLTGQIPEIGGMLCPMHLPVLLCGLLCSPIWAAAVGFIAPLLRFVLFGMPPLMPTGLAMCFELAAYGLVSCLLIRRLPESRLKVWLALIPAMLCGRIVWGIVRVLLSGVSGSAFTWTAFMAGAFTNAIPGIIVQLVLLPVLFAALRHALPATGHIHK